MEDLRSDEWTNDIGIRTRSNTEASMNSRLAGSALAIGALTVVMVFQNLSAARSNDQRASAPTTATSNTSMLPHKHRHWRHRGGIHPHYGSRLVRARGSKETEAPPGK